MADNILVNIAEHLGVELNEEFLVDTYKAKFRITKNNFERADYPCGNTNEWSSACREIFFDLLYKKSTIKKLPWLPKIGEKCFKYRPDGWIEEVEFSGFLITCLKCGCLFRTRNEALNIGKQRYEALMDEYANGTICKEV